MNFSTPWPRISEYAGAAGLDHVEVEITPLAREVPSTVDQSLKLLSDLDGRCRVPVRLLVDVGHALYQPLYGPQVTLDGWLAGLGTSIGAFHLQNTDFQSDSHWGWPDRRGRFDVAAFGRQVAAAAIGDVPCYLEVIYPFEEADEDVLASIKSSVIHCRQAVGRLRGVEAEQKRTGSERDRLHVGGLRAAPRCGFELPLELAEPASYRVKARRVA